MIVYHLSPSRNRESILKHGLIPQAKNGLTISYAPRIFVSSCKKNKYHFAGDFVGYEWIDVWQLEISDVLIPDEFSGKKHHFYISKSVSSDKLVLHKSW